MGEIYKISAAMLWIERNGANADSNASRTYDILKKGIQQITGEVSLLVSRTAGSTDTIAVSLQGSNDSVNWTDVISETDVTGGVSDTTFASGKACRFYRIFITTVGAGNTLTVWGTIA